MGAEIKKIDKYCVSSFKFESNKSQIIKINKIYSSSSNTSMDPSKSQNFLDSTKEADIRKVIDYLKNVTYTLSQGQDIKKEIKLVLNQFIAGRHRVIKLICYPILKEFPDLDYSSLQGTVSSDLTSGDPELQLNAIKLMYNFPVDLQIELLRAHEKEFQKIVVIAEYHYEKMTCLSDVLLKCYIQSGLQEENCNEIVFDLYTKIAELIFYSNRDSPSTALMVFRSIFHQYLTMSYDAYKLDRYFDGNGSISQIIRPLIIHITNYLFPNFNTLVTVVNSFELRTRAQLMSFPIMLLEVALALFQEHYHFSEPDILAEVGKKDLRFVMSNNIALPFSQIIKELLKEIIIQDSSLITYEIDVWGSSFQNAFHVLGILNKPQWQWVLSLSDRQELLKTLFLTFCDDMEKIYYKRELNVILLNFATLAHSLNNSYRLFISMKTLEFTEKNVINSIDRYVIYLQCFISLIQVSIDLFEKNEKSAIYGLFQQSWFISKIQEKEEESAVRFKEEFLVCFMKAAIIIQNDLATKKQSLKTFLSVLGEALDMCTRVIDWKMEYLPYNEYQRTSYFSALDLYFVLLESIYQSGEPGKLHNHISELIKRINGQELAFDIKVKVLGSLTRKADQSVVSYLNVGSLVKEFRGVLISHSTAAIFDSQFVHKLPGSLILRNFISQIEMMLAILYNISLKTTIDHKGDIINLFADFTGYLQGFQKKQELFQPLVNAILEYAEIITRFMMEAEETDLNDKKINMNFLDRIEFAVDEDYDESDSQRSFRTLSYGFNIIYMKQKNQNETFMNDILEFGNPVDNLTLAALSSDNPEEMNIRSRKPILVSGIGDILQIFARHAINSPHSLVAISLQFININKYQITKVKVEALYPDSLDLYPEVCHKKVKRLHEMSQYTESYLTFCFEVKRVVNAAITFEVMIDIQELDDPISFKTLPYYISFIDFTVPNYMMMTHMTFFENIWRNIPYHTIVKCRVVKKFEDALKALQKRKLCVRQVEGPGGKKLNKISVLGYTWDDNNFGVSINEDLQIGKVEGMVINLEIRCSNMGIIENIKEDSKFFVEQLADDSLEFLQNS